MKAIHYILYALAGICLAACDSGDIAEKTYQVSESGLTVKLTAQVSGLQEWKGTGYSLTLAGFMPDSRFALLQRALPSADDGDTPLSLVLSNLSNEVQTVELALTNSLRERIITLSSLDMNAYRGRSAHDTIRLDLGHIDASRLGVLQTGLFDRACIQCHGGNGRTAAGLNLTRGKTAAALIGTQSPHGYPRVEPGNANASLLHIILAPGGENILAHNHTEILSSQFRTNYEEVRTLVDQWINSLKQ